MKQIRQIRRSPREAVQVLILLYRQEFGGKTTGRYRISRKAMRLLLGRRRIRPGEIEEMADEMFEEGYLLIDLETHFAVLEQRIVNNYRRVTSAALAGVAESV